MIWSDSLLQYDYWIIAKARPNSENAMKLPAHLSKARPQADVAKSMTFGPINKEAYDQIPAELSKWLPPRTPRSRIIKTSHAGRARHRRLAAFAEAGANGLIDEASVALHVNGVLRIARLLGMSDEENACLIPSSSPPAKVVTANRYLWVRAEADGWCQYAAEPSDVWQATAHRDDQRL